MKKKIGAILIVCIILTGICGCQEIKKNHVNEATEKISGVELKIAFWGASGEEAALQKAAEGMEDKIDGIGSVVWEQFPSVKEFYDALPTEAAIGKMPDLVMLNNEEQISLIEGGFLEPLAISPDPMDYGENVLDEWMNGEQLYGMPQTASPALFIINEDLWKAVGLTDYPATWEEVYETSKIIKSRGFTPICIDFSNMYHITQYLLSFGGGWQKGRNMASKENCQAVAYILRMFDEGLAVTAQDKGRTWDGEVFSSEECVMSTGGTWYIGAMKETPDIHYTMMPVPRTDQANGKTLHSYGFSVMKGSQNKELAEEAVQYMVRAEAQKMRMEITGDCPALLSMQQEYYERYPQMSFMKEELKYVKSFDYPVDLAVLDNVREKLRKRIYGESLLLTPEEILTK